MTDLDTEWSNRAESQHVDKTDWYRGEWDDEPDRVEWRYAGTPRFPLLIVRGPHGALCGYVGVPPGHPHHDTKDPFHLGLEVHGGITYGERCQEGGDICHVPRNGESPDVYWLGFDCAHCWDYSGMATRRHEDSEHAWMLCRPHSGMGESYRSIHYVRREVERLAEQLARVAKGQEAAE